MSAIERFRPGGAPSAGSTGSTGGARIPPVSPQMAFRVAILGGIAVVMFAVIFFRLWYLQVLTGERYVQEAAVNSVRDLPIAAPRGQIFDREGKPIVASTVTNAVQIVPSALPPAGAPRLELYRRLGALLGMSAAHVEALVIKGRTALPYAPVTIRTDAGHGVLTVLAERQNEFPGVTQQPVSIRSYPYGEMAAQVLGYVGQVTERELKLRPFAGVKQGTVVGQEGLEYYYDRYLRGNDGVQRVQVDSAGYPVPTRLQPTPPKAGYSLKVTLDLGLQHEAEKALLQGVENARAGGKPAQAGAFTAIDPRNGQILAIGSYPSFDPNKFAKLLTESEYKALEGRTGSEEAPSRLTNRAVNGAYPTGSTFKPFTAMGALEAGVINPSQGLGAGQCIHVSTQQFCNAGKADYGPVGLVEALKVSSDTYFFEVGELANRYHEPIQNMARQLGIGHSTGIDLPSEIQGTIPDPAWRERQNRLQEKCEHAKHRGTCDIVAEVRPWSVGDNMDLAVGQGDLLTSPLQMAVAYSTLANAFMHGGYGAVVRPHLGMAIDETDGSLVQSLNFPPVRHVRLNYSDLSLVMEGIHEAASQPGGTSADVWRGWDQTQHPVYGKTGTAEHTGKEDQSWYMCFVGDPQRPIVIAVTVEQGGFGAETAAPIARLIASRWFGKPEQFVAGTSKTR
ncbi:MAG TPA: penicillin-binding protein 2 [Solirubrobacteraceae bacterium]|jgi:penicillin-binding protein 2|nr:penicillin-binding protein 2 [Solirubrobacteraceae bacterium]